jgi:hypothetical protein
LLYRRFHLVKGTTKSTSSDFDGNYGLKSLIKWYFNFLFYWYSKASYSRENSIEVKLKPESQTRLS